MCPLLNHLRFWFYQLQFSVILGYSDLFRRELEQLGQIRLIDDVERSSLLAIISCQ
ncbi:MAG: hypothetical protein MI924_03955 [Chloroflexales bacterium]|nr:hypothetical protein [Chloroflexales bacterium]